MLFRQIGTTGVQDNVGVLSPTFQRIADEQAQSAAGTGYTGLPANGPSVVAVPIPVMQPTATPVSTSPIPNVVTVTPQTVNSNGLLIAGVGLGALFLLSGKGKSKKMSGKKATNNMLLIGGGLVALYLFTKNNIPAGVVTPPIPAGPSDTAPMLSVPKIAITTRNPLAANLFTNLPVN